MIINMEINLIFCAKKSISNNEIIKIVTHDEKESYICYTNRIVRILNTNIDSLRVSFDRRDYRYT